MPITSKENAEAHWGYLDELLKAHLVCEEERRMIGFHYRTAFIHGYKHGQEDVCNAPKYLVDSITRVNV